MKAEDKSIQRFWSKVEIQASGCWHWTAAKMSDGYGAWSFVDIDRGKQRSLRAHRFAYWAIYGDLSKPELHHTCNEKICVNPDHLKPMTRKEHMNATPGTWGYEWAQLTHCEKGHPLEGDNLLPFALKKGIRRCRECQIEASRDWRKANPEKMRAAVASWADRNRERKRRADRERYHGKKSSVSTEQVKAILGRLLD